MIDVCVPETWPANLHDLVTKLSGSTPPASYANDLEVPDGADKRVRATLAGHRLRVYHATRLLDHERDMIAKQGLLPFSRELFDGRIRAAYAHGSIDAATRDILLNAHMYATGEAHGRGRREGQVCVVLSDLVFDDCPMAVEPLLSTWGGEGLYFSSRGETLAPFLRSLASGGPPSSGHPCRSCQPTPASGASPDWPASWSAPSARCASKRTSCIRRRFLAAPYWTSGSPAIPGMTATPRCLAHRQPEVLTPTQEEQG